ncbi:MAG: hypothetical protein R3C14_28325 [Caldilineaceae bacterium]
MEELQCQKEFAQDQWPVLDSELEQPVSIVIYVSKDCFVCDYAYEVAATIRREFPEVAIDIVDIAETTTTIPESVFATPTYLLNGRLWSLGNPAPEKVTTTLRGLCKAIGPR